MRTLALSLAAALVAATASAQTATSPECRPALDPAHEEFVIDTTSGAATGATHYELTDQVRVLLINQNPFLYDYKLEVEEAEIEEGGLAAFIKAFLPIASLSEGGGKKEESGTGSESGLTSAGTAGAEALISKKAKGKAHPCGEIYSQAAAFRASLDGAHGDLQVEKDATATAVEAALAQFEVFAEAANTQTKIVNAPFTTCPALPNAARAYINLVTDYEGANRLAELRKTLSEFSKHLTKQEELIAVYRSLFEDQVAACRELIASEASRWQDRVDAFRAKDLAAFDSTADKLTTALTEAKKRRDDVQTVLIKPNAFYTYHDLGPYDRPSDVTVTVKRKTAGDEKAKFADLGSWQLNFGGPARFSISAGFAYSSLDERSFKVVKGFARNRAGELRMENMAEVFTDVIAIDDESDSRVTPLVLLNGRLWRPKATSKVRRWLSGFHLSLGVSGKIEGDSVKAELLVGPTLSFIEERLFLTVGAYRGRVARLADDLFVGGEVPDEAKGEIPTSHESRWTLGAALTYRIK